MTLLPEPQMPAEMTGQPLSEWPPAPLTGTVELASERGPIKWVPDAWGRMVPMPSSQVEPLPARTQPRNLAPTPLLDPIAQRLIGAGIGGGALSAGIGYGIGQTLTAAAGFTSGAGIWLALLLVVLLRAPASTVPAGSTVNIRKAVIKRNRFHG